MCEHLIKLEEYLDTKNIRETYRGRAWSKNCRIWIYYDCILDINSLKERFKFDECVRVHEYNDIKVGSERGFICIKCNDAIMGKRPVDDNKNSIIVY